MCLDYNGLKDLLLCEQLFLLYNAERDLLAIAKLLA